MFLRSFARSFVTLTALAGPVSALEQGRDGTLKILYWQAPTILNPYLSGGIKDIEAASLVLEPLARYGPDGVMRPWLAEDIPTLANGGISADKRSITWRLKQDLTWSDGSAVTAEDIRFTHAYCTAPGGGCSQADKFRGVADVEVLDPLTARVTFDAPRPNPYGPFVGPQAPILQAAQFSACLGPAAPSCTAANFAPIGTGPFKVVDFRPGDAIQFVANPGYREPGKPAFADVTFKGGGSPAAAARTVLETGEFDYAWNLQLRPEMLSDMQARGKGRVTAAFSTLVERLAFNLTYPDPALGDARATIAHPHPVLSDANVRRALSMALDRPVMVEIGYGTSGRATCNIIPAPPAYASDANEDCLVQDLDGARAALDMAGWTDSDGDGVRDKEGRALNLVLQTSTNAVRQDFQVLIKEWWRQIGVETELRNIEPSVFFGADPSSPDTFQKFYADVQMFAGASDGTDPEGYLSTWFCGRAPAPENQWQGANISRWCNPAFDALGEELSGTGGVEARAALARQMNDMLVQSHVVLPLVDRGRVSAHVLSLGGVEVNAWDSELWNIADWTRLPD